MIKSLRQTLSKVKYIFVALAAASSKNGTQPAFNLDLVILACFANEPISMMAATFQSDINHQFKLGEPQQKIKHYIE